MAIERSERVEPEPQPSNASVIFNRDEPDYIVALEAADVPPPDDDDENMHRATGAGARSVYRDHRERCRLIDINPHLSELGKADAKAKLLPEFLKRLEPYDKIVASREEALAERKAELLPDVKSKDAVQEQKAVELRRWFMDQPADKRPSIIRQALAEDNRGLLAALIDANPVMNLMHEKVREALVATILEKDFPDAVAEVAVRERRLVVAKAALTRVRELLQGNTPTSMRERLTASK